MRVKSDTQMHAERRPALGEGEEVRFFRERREDGLRLAEDRDGWFRESGAEAGLGAGWV